MKMSGKARARGGGRGVRPGRGAGAILRKMYALLPKLSPAEALGAINVFEGYAWAGGKPPGFIKPGPPPGVDHLKASYRAALPFEIHESDDASPFMHRSRDRDADSEQCSRLYGRIVNLSEYEGTTADQALAAGLRVSIKCSPDFAPDIAGAFAQRVPSRTLVFYDEETRRLVFRHENEEAIHDKQAEQEK